jgi:hypothetical protein
VCLGGWRFRACLRTRDRLYPTFRRRAQRAVSMTLSGCLDSVRLGGIGIIGHGCRRRPAHDCIHDWILVRRGICKACGGTLTVLPWWCVPGAAYSLLARHGALQQLAQGASTEQAAPHCRDPDRLPDASTVRRWFWRHMENLRSRALPTMAAWDWRTVRRILASEPLSP